MYSKNIILRYIVPPVKCSLKPTRQNQLIKLLVLSPWKGYPVKQGRIIPKLVTVIFQGTLGLALAHSLGRGIHAGTEHAVYPADSVLWLTAGRRPATVGARPRLQRLSQSRYGQLSFHWLAAASPPRTEMEAFFSYQLFIFLFVPCFSRDTSSISWLYKSQ